MSELVLTREQPVETIEPDAQPKTAQPEPQPVRGRWFFLRVALFTLPFAVAFFFVSGFLMWVGESMPLWMVVEMQQSDTPVLFRPAYGNRDEQFKLLSANVNQPQVLVIGSSRVLQFREHFLTENPDAFYNAAAPAWQLDEISSLLFNLETIPPVILLGVDPVWFNEDYPGDPIVEPPMSDYARIWRVNRTFIQELLDGETFDVPLLLRREEPGGSGGIALGLRAIRDGHGFRNDGSEQYGDFLVAQYLWPPNLRGHHMGLFERGEEMYTEGSVVSETRLAQLDQILQWAQENDVLLIGFSPPYMPTLWDELAVSERHTYIQQLLPILEQRFTAYGFPYYEYSDGADLGATDEDFFDGWHGSERVAAQIYINIARDIPELDALSNLDALQEIVDTASDTFRVFSFIAPR